MPQPASGPEHGLAQPESLRAQLDLLIGSRRRYIVMLAIVSAASGFAEAIMVALVAEVAADLAGGKSVHAKTALFHINAPVTTLLWVSIVFALARLLLQWPLSVLPARVAADVQESLRRRVFRAFTNASWEVQSSDREGAVQEVMTSQTMQATGGALQATTLVSSSLIFLIMMLTAVLLNPIAAGAVFVIAVALFLLMRPLRRLGNRRSRELSRAQLEYAGAIAEANRLAEESHVFGVMDVQYARIRGYIRRCRALYYRTQVLAKAVPNVYQSLIFVVLAVGLAAFYEVGPRHPERLLAIILLLVRAAQQGQSFQGAYQGLQQSLPFIDRLRDAEQRYARSAPPKGDAHLPAVRTIGFEEVSFAYVPGRPVLQGVSFAVEAGEAIGIVGPSGAGKSTLVQILLALRLPQEGRYVLNGKDVADFSQEEWHTLVAYVPQEPRLMHASVTENIRFFRDIDQESIERAATLARVHEDIVGWSKGYDTTVGPRADAVSGGQQQRICLARALAARPQVLVLDEPTSALDPHSETLIQESLLALKSELTLFTIAHRMSTLDMCDRVMVILEGRLVAFDTKAVLQEQNHYYRTASMIAGSVASGIVP